MINKTSCNCKMMHAICKYRCNMCTRLPNSSSDQTNAIPHWLWNQPSAPPVHPEDGVKGCLGNAGESVGAAQDVIMPLPYQLDKAKPSENKINNARSYNLELMVHCFYMFNKTSCNCKMIRAICKCRCNMRTKKCTLCSDQTNAIPHWLWNQPSAPPVHPEDGVKGCLGNAGESVGAAQDVIMPLPYQLDKAKPSENKINNARSYNLELMVHCFYMINKTSCNCKMIRAICKYRCNMCTR